MRTLLKKIDSIISSSDSKNIETLNSHIIVEGTPDVCSSEREKDLTNNCTRVYV